MATVARRIVTAVPSVGASAARTDREYVKEPVTSEAVCAILTLYKSDCNFFESEESEDVFV